MLLKETSKIIEIISSLKLCFLNDYNFVMFIFKNATHIFKKIFFIPIQFFFSLLNF